MKTNLNDVQSFWIKNAKIISLFIFLSLCSCKEEVTNVAANEKNKEVINDFILFDLPGKRGAITYKRTKQLSPFENSYLTLPADYSGTTFSLKHDYPVMGSVETPKTYPWKTVTKNGAINQKNALDYIQALKKHVSADMRKLLFDYDNLNPNKEPWYQSIWLGQVREPIHGMYVGSSFPAKTLGATQEKSLTTYVYTLYDKMAAQTLNNIWGTDSINAYKPNLDDVNNTQYAEGSIIVKFAFVNYNNVANNWSILDGSAAWSVYTDVIAGQQSPANKGARPAMQTLKLMQFDILVKDSKAAPKTGWVFTTLVYDKNAPGKDAWDKMVPLGATWGNNPEIVAKITNTKALEDATVPAPVDVLLTENWINPIAPTYAKTTLGWGGRLSGPNDGAVFSTGPVTTSTSGKTFTDGGVSTISCLGCHSTAQYKQTSFLIPVVFSTQEGIPFVLDPGSKLWNRYFRNNVGRVPFDLGSISLDYDMVTSFKAIPAWQEAVSRR